MQVVFDFIKHKAYVFLILLLAVFVGVFAGLVCAVFGRGLLLLDALRVSHPLFFIPFLGAAGIIIVSAYKSWGGSSAEGVSLIFEVGYGEKPSVPKRIIPFIIISTWISNLFGASVGREGVAIQIGAGLGFRVGKIFRNDRIARILLIAGIAGGFGGLFRTPIAAVFFALEVLVAGSLAYEAFLPSLITAFTASFVSGKLGVPMETILMDAEISFTAGNIFRIVIASLAFCMVGRIFSTADKKMRLLLQKILPNDCARIFIVGLAISIASIALYRGRYSGLSLGITHSVFHGGKVYLWDWILKILFTVISLSAGFQSGEISPLLCIGSSFGYVFAGIVKLPPVLCAALGSASVLGSATNTFLAPMFIGCEVFGFKYLPYFFITCAIAYACNGNNTIYGKQRLSSML